MNRTCRSENCSGPLEQGDEVVQLLRGIFNQGFITPAFATLQAEWHVGCFHEVKLKPQRARYECELCQARIANGQEVWFFVVGKQTDPEHIVSEARGREIYSVAHVKCQVEKANNPT